MNPEEIKVGDKVLVEAEVYNVYNDGDIGCFTQYTAHDGGIDETKFDVLCSLVHKMTDSTAPKYDPNRKFREGDEVRPIMHKGRIFSLYWKKYIGKNLTVTKSEDAFNLPEVNGQPIDPAYLELVTPVEELRPYFISEGAGIIEIWNRKREVVKTWYYGAVKAGVEALAAAEVERDRLNAEYRKEQK